MLILPSPLDYVPEPITVTGGARTASTAASASHTFNSQTLGAAAPNRSVIVGVALNGTTVHPVTALTVDGVSATYITSASSSGGFEIVEFWAVKLPDTNTNTSVTIAVTLAGALAGSPVCAIFPWTVYNLQGLAALDTDTDNTPNANPSLAIDAFTSGAVFGVSSGNLSPAATWTGLSEDADGITSTVGSSSAHLTFLTGSAAFAVTVSLTGTQTNQVVVLISVR